MDQSGNPADVAVSTERVTDLPALHRPARAPRRRRRWLGWLGFPSGADAAQHVRMIWRHFLSLIGWRA